LARVTICRGKEAKREEHNFSKLPSGGFVVATAALFILLGEECKECDAKYWERAVFSM
jgi:hypothetical protein